MNTTAFMIIFFPFAICAIVSSVRLFFLRHHDVKAENITTKYDNPFSVQEMSQLERQLKDCVLFQKSELKNSSSIEVLCEKLKLELERSDTMLKGEEAELVHSENENYNGKIILLNDLKPSGFACVHEIMHYIFDVGYGNKVPIGHRYPRMINSEGTDPDERKMDYLAAAYTMPYEEILKEIEKYDDRKSKMTSQAFLENLMSTYHQSETATIRRVREVRRLSNAKAQAQIEI